jgi:hypothetical protein
MACAQSSSTSQCCGEKLVEQLETASSHVHATRKSTLMSETLSSQRERRKTRARLQAPRKRLDETLHDPDKPAHFAAQNGIFEDTNRATSHAPQKLVGSS